MSSMSIHRRNVFKDHNFAWVTKLVEKKELWAEKQDGHREIPRMALCDKISSQKEDHLSDCNSTRCCDWYILVFAHAWQYLQMLRESVSDRSCEKRCTTNMVPTKQGSSSLRQLSSQEVLERWENLVNLLELLADVHRKCGLLSYQIWTVFTFDSEDMQHKMYLDGTLLTFLNYRNAQRHFLSHSRHSRQES